MFAPNKSPLLAIVRVALMPVDKYQSKIAFYIFPKSPTLNLLTHDWAVSIQDQIV
ncbi:hypothetical protein QCA50_018893 [Cerrena zonata]|uniref:Uncharacterized protein n=1 Tax=Cerrena zonata TaxID=2478898 RepID=A0AAW0FN67_9APHY